MHFACMLPPMSGDIEKVWETDGKCCVTGFAQFREQVVKFTAPRDQERNRFLFRGVATTECTLLPSLAREMRKKPWIIPSLLYHIEK